MADTFGPWENGSYSHPPKCSHPRRYEVPRHEAAGQQVSHCPDCDADLLPDGSRLLSPEITERWDEFWADIVTDRNGNVDVEQVKCELHDYWTCIEEVPKVYGEITANTMSKPNYLATEVIGVHDERCPNVTALIEEIRELFGSRGDYEDVIDSADAASRLEEVLERHETLHSSMYREERARETEGQAR